MAIKQTWDLHVTHLLLTTIEAYDGLRDEVIDRLVSTFGGEATGGAFESVHIHCHNPACSEDSGDSTEPGLLNVASPSGHEAQGRVLDFEFVDKDEAIAAAVALREIGSVIGVYLHWVKEDDQQPEDGDRRYEFADDLEYDWSRFEDAASPSSAPLN